MNVLLINSHQHYPFSEGKLNNSLVELAKEVLESKGYQLQFTRMDNTYDVAEELEKHTWADVIIVQAPVNWMGMPWTFKKYMDDVYTAGMGGELCNGDGRSRDDAARQYGSGGTLQGKRYMLSLTFNAPQAAFDDPDQYLFQGKGVDDLFFPMHMNFRFFGMEPIDTFVCYDVMKNPSIEQDFWRFQQHLNQHL
ncbi:modulator of drug activity B [Elysia marginata]|uniref:Modulator of drug activity B n=1 Tax=Elysia marginata TaxID=1093978 RepID=A0AAV4F5X2_9GAST|nr:modulator of drug activity B [Elysia marginata]